MCPQVISLSILTVCLITTQLSTNYVTPRFHYNGIQDTLAYRISQRVKDASSYLDTLQVSKSDFEIQASLDYITTTENKKRQLSFLEPQFEDEKSIMAQLLESLKKKLEDAAATPSLNVRPASCEIRKIYNFDECHPEKDIWYNQTVSVKPRKIMMGQFYLNSNELSKISLTLFLTFLLDHKLFPFFLCLRVYLCFSGYKSHALSSFNFKDFSKN